MKLCHCRRCRRPLAVCGKLSQYGRCVDCACAIVARNVRQLASGEGSDYERWLKAIKKWAETA